MTEGWRTSTTRPGNGPGIPSVGRGCSCVRPVNCEPSSCQPRKPNQPRGAPTASPAPAPSKNPRRVMPQQPFMAVDLKCALWRAEQHGEPSSVSCRVEHQRPHGLPGSLRCSARLNRGSNENPGEYYDISYGIM